MTTIFPAVLIIAISISITLFAILINNIYAQKRSNKLLSAFSDAASEFNLSLSKIERVGSRIIGLDEEKSKALFLVRTKNKYDGYLIDLAEIEKCTVKKKYQANGAAYIKRLGVDVCVESVVLQFHYKNGAKPLSLPFYEKAKDHIYDIRKRTDQAHEWQSILSSTYKGSRNEVEIDKRNIWYWYGQLAGV